MGTEQHVLISRVILPTEYRPGFTSADIALLKAYRPFTLTEYVQPVAIWWQTEYDSCEILTWKRQNETDQSDNQREVLGRSLFIEKQWKTSDCYQVPVLFNILYFRSEEFQQLEDTKEPVCQGNVGSPIVCNYEIVGIINRGHGCATTGIFTNITIYNDWMHESMATY